MANLKDIRRKIKSVKNTQKTTKAMKLVSTAKLKRAETAAKKSKSYAEKLNDMISEIAFKINQYKVGGIESRFFENTESPKTVDILFITADKGLCGGFNMQTIKRVNGLLEKYQASNIRLRAVGRKGIAYFSFKGISLLEKEVGVSSAPTYEKGQKIINRAIEDFILGKTDKVVLIYNGYKNMITQEVREIDLVPVKTPDKEFQESGSLMEIEPEDNEQVLEELLKKYFEYNMYYALIDSLAAEHSARMQAMDAASKNAKERAHQLTLAYNKARQESITTELIEIISGMESMK